jgi:uncharacterized RDD family membrane protein YckC
MSQARVPYAGVATRALGLALDVAIVHVIVFAGGAILALIASLVGDLKLDTVGRIICAVAWAGAVATYFVTFWSTVGQTPGMRVMDVRVTTAGGELPGFWRSVVRVVGLALAIIPLFAGFLPVLVDDRRRALQDFMAGTVVIHGGLEPPPSPEPAASAVGAGAGHGAPA